MVTFFVVVLLLLVAVVFSAVFFLVAEEAGVFLLLVGAMVVITSAGVSAAVFLRVAVEVRRDVFGVVEAVSASASVPAFLRADRWVVFSLC